MEIDIVDNELRVTMKIDVDCGVNRCSCVMPMREVGIDVIVVEIDVVDELKR